MQKHHLPLNIRKIKSLYNTAEKIRFMSVMDKTKILAVCGPTASGKTALAIELAKKIGGEIISCDSMQIYRKMDIGTAKPTEEEQHAVRHHLIDIIDPDTDFSCADYKRLAEDAVSDIVARGKVPVFCGGTGLYLDNVIYNNGFSSCERNDELRAELDSLDSVALHLRLRELDPVSAESIHPNNRKRVIRAIEICVMTGRPKSEWDAMSRVAESPYDACVVMPDWDRDILYRRIDTRVDKMLEEGLAGEAARLRKEYGENLSLTASQAIGYKELYDYLDGKMSLATAAENIKTATRNYAKRQLTWFRHREYVRCVPMSEDTKCEEIVNLILGML